ncbi:hypothetical protein HDU79_002130 [Rhizoclosmatium sp. JEL0117]|nr:hypothetical protein HDU79_002130 [Rhizoclosmatium sp. JEL0117]
MSSKPSKKEAERNAKQLESLLEVPENRVCADCGDSKPKWASANIGVFLCIRCAGLHRNLGREISVIKSVALDSWTASEVETMSRIGNRRANALYLATGSAPKPSERDIAKFYMNSGMLGQGGPQVSDKEMYRFIKDKYKKGLYMKEKDRRDLEARHSGRGGRSASGGSSSGGNRHQQQRDEPVTIEPDDHVTFSGQLKILQSMGFTDTTKSIIALKRSKGGIDAAIERLINSANEPAPTVQQPSQPAPTHNEDLSKTLRDALNFLDGMGFKNRDDNLAALKKSKGDVDAAVNILVELQNSKPAQQSQQPQYQQQPSQTNFGLDLLSLNEAPQQQPASDPFNGFFGGQSQLQQQQQVVAQQQYGQFQQFQQFQQPQIPQQQQAWMQPQQQQQQQFAQLQSQPQQQLPTQFIPQQQASNVTSANMAPTQFAPQPLAQSFNSLPSQSNAFNSLGQQPQQNAFGIQQPQQLAKPNYNVAYTPSSSVFNRPQNQQQLSQGFSSQPKNDPFAALVKDSHMMPQQQSGFSQQPVSPQLQQQQIPLGMLSQQRQAQLLMGQQSQQQPQFSAYSVAPQQAAVPFGGFGQVPQNQVPRNTQPQQPQMNQQQQQQFNPQQQQQFSGYQF